MVQPEDSAEVVVRRVTDLIQTLHVKVEELWAQLVPTTPQVVYDERRIIAEQVVEAVKKRVNEYDTMLTEVVQTWSDLAAHPYKVKIQAQLEELQRKQEELKQAIKNMLPQEQMKKAKDAKTLKQQFDNLKKHEENTVARIEPLQEATAILARFIGKKQGELRAFLE